MSTSDQQRPLLRDVLPRELEPAVARLEALSAPPSLLESRLILPAIALVLGGILAGVLAFQFATRANSDVGTWLVLAALVLTVVAFGVLVARIRGQVSEPVYELRKWIARMLNGDLGARLPESRGGEYASLAQDINILGEAVGQMCANVDRHARSQMEQLARKTRSLEILYDAVAGVDVSHDVDDLLNRFLITLRDLIGARAGVVRMAGSDNNMRVVGSVGCHEHALVNSIAMEKCLCGVQLADELLLQGDLSACAEELRAGVAHDGDLAMITIPIRYNERTLGVYNFFLSDTSIIRRDDISHLFNSVGRHLGLAIEKARLERQTRRLSIMEERTLLANELHDSLAQTLASLRFQVSLVEETVSQSKDRTGIRQIRTIKDGLDQANSQLRELLAHFRTRMDERGLIPAIESVVERFRTETGIATFFQNEIHESNFPPTLEVQVLHIVQEALTNIRKHSDAQNVRVLLRSDNKGGYDVLVEDDGQGIEEEVVSGPPGEHIGLSIMRERAARLGGTLNIESEPGEGTRVELHFHATPHRRARDRDEFSGNESES